MSAGPAPDDQARAAEALHQAFTRLAPQGSDAWNFLAAFTHLGDRYGPYHPGASALSDALTAQDGEARRAGPLDRLRPRFGLLRSWIVWPWMKWVFDGNPRLTAT